MTGQSLLNTDVRQLGRTLLAGFGWWRAEILALAPPAWRLALSGAPSLIAVADLEAGQFIYRRNGKAISPPPRRSDAIPARIVLPPGEALVRPLALPPLSLPDLKRIAEGELERLTPFRREAACWAVEGASVDGPASLGVASRATVERVISLAKEQGLSPWSVTIAEADGEAFRFDLMPTLRGEVRNGRRGWLWALAVGLAMANLGLFVLLDAIDLRDLEHRTSLMTTRAAPAAALRDQVETEARRRAALLADRRATDPLAMLAAASQALPAGVWVQRLEWDGHSGRLVGFKPADFDIASALRGSPAFTNPRVLTIDAPMRAGAPQPFDVTIDASAPKP